MIPRVNRDEALQILEHRGAILDIAREISSLMRSAGIDGAVIGGVAVVLHGYIRSTADVNLFVPDSPERITETLKSAGFTFDSPRMEFSKSGVPVHLVLIDQVKHAPSDRIELDGITTVGLASLIELKLRSGSSNPLRAQDLADAIGLMRHHHLGGEFAARLGPDIRSEFKKLVDAIGRG
jgi:hypothetical protein